MIRVYQIVTTSDHEHEAQNASGKGDHDGHRDRVCRPALPGRVLRQEQARHVVPNLLPPELRPSLLFLLKI